MHHLPAHARCLALLVSGLDLNINNLPSTPSRQNQHSAPLFPFGLQYHWQPQLLQALSFSAAYCVTQQSSICAMLPSPLSKYAHSACKAYLPAMSASLPLTLRRYILRASTPTTQRNSNAFKLGSMRTYVRGMKAIVQSRLSRMGWGAIFLDSTVTPFIHK